MSGADTGTRLLLVDDDPAFREAARDALAGAFDGRVDAVGSAARDPIAAGGAYDAVVCSEGLAGADALEVVERLADAGTPVVLLFETGDTAGAAAAAGATDYFPRVEAPAQYEVVADRIHDALEAGGNRPGGAPPSRLRADGDGTTAGDTGGVPGADEQFRLVTEHVDELIFITKGIVGPLGDDERAEPEYMSPAYERIYGRPVEEVYEDPGVLLEAVHPEDREAYEAMLDRMAADEREGDLEDSYGERFRIQRPDGEVRWLEGTVYPAETAEDGLRWVGITRDVTERERLERQVRERERTYRGVFENVTDGLVVHDPETGEILDANERYCEMNGYDREELVGADVGLVTAPGERYSYEEARARIERAREEGPQLFEWRNQRADGETFPVEVHLAVTHFHGEERVLASVRDITDRREREREREEERQKYSTLVEQSQDGVVIVQDGVYEFVNEAFCDITGYGREELLGTAFDEVFPPGDRGTVRERYERRIEGEEPSQRYDIRVETAGGDLLDVELTVSRIRHEGEPATMANFRDITERKRLERQVRESERRFRQIAERIDEVIYLGPIDLAEVYYINPAYEEVWGRPVEEVYDDPERFVEHIHPEDREAYRDRVRGMLRDLEGGDLDDHYEFEYRIRRPDGEVRWVEAMGYPVLTGDDEENRFVGVVTDVTERRRRERVVRRLHDATQRIQDAETTQAVCDAAVGAARDVLDLPMTACWLYREDADVLDPVAGTDPVMAMEGGPVSFGPGDFEYGVHTEGETAVYDPSEYYDHNPLDAAVIVPLGDHGLLAAGAPGRTDYEEFLVDAARTLAEHTATALSRAVRAEELRASERRFREIIERVDQVIYYTEPGIPGGDDPDVGEVLYANPAYEELFGRDRADLYADPDRFVAAIHPEDRDAYRRALAGMLEDFEAGEVDPAYEFEYRIRRADGEVRWVEATDYPVPRGSDSPERVVGVAEDVTAERRRERTLETFHGATRELTEATSRAEASRTAVEAAREVLEFPLVSVHLYEESTGELEALAATDGLAADPGELPAFAPGDDLPWQVFVDGGAVRREADDADLYGPGTPDPELVVSLGPHGVMLVGTGDADPGDEQVELAQILAATVEAALNHLEGERELAERERELREQTRRAERLDRLNSVIRDIEQATIEKSTRAEVERAVCERLTDVEPYGAAWIGRADAGEGVTVEASDGDVVPPETVGDGATDAHPAREALESRSVTVVRGLATGTGPGEWHKPLLRRGHQSVLAVPLVYEGTARGVLVVAASDPTAFDEEERAVLEELGRSLAHAFTVQERRLALESDTTTELEFRVADDGLLFVDVADRVGARVELERTVRRPDGTVSVFYGVEDADPTEVVGATRRTPGVADAGLVTADDRAGLIEVSAETWFGAPFTDRGAVIRTAWARDGEGRLVVEAPRSADVRAIVEGFEERHPDVELVAKRRRERAVRTLLELQDALEERLTDRQFEALETAYSAGYFEWPRGSSGQDIADLLGITQPTFNKHLRAAERKAFTMLLDREYPDEG